MSTMSDKNKMAITQRIKFGFARGTNKVLRKGKDHLTASMQQLEREEKNFSDKKHNLRNLSMQFDKYCLKLAAYKRATSTLEGCIAGKTILEDDAKSDEYDDTIKTLRKAGDSYLNEAKRIVHESLEKIKKVKNTYQDYLTAKKSYEKCKEDKMIKAKNMVDTLEEAFEKLLRQANDEIPQNHEIVANNLEHFVREYARSKKEFLEAEIKATVNFSSKQGITAIADGFQSSYQPASSASLPDYGNTNSNTLSATACLANLARDTPPPHGHASTPEYKYSSNSQNAGISNGRIGDNNNDSTDLSSIPPPYKVTALYVYSSEEPDELTFNVGEEIQVLEWSAEEQEPGWLYGKNLRTAETGIFPINYVKKN